MNIHPLRGVAALVVALAVSACASAPADSAAAGSRAPRPGSAHTSRPTAGAGVARADADAPSATAAGFARWLAAFARRAAARGVAPATLAAAFGPAVFEPRVIELDRRQPEFSRAIWTYLDSAVSARRVARGRAMGKRYARAARAAAARYGVARDVIVAVWGMETNYGDNLGGYETIDALATLGYDGRREDFAERQLDAALEILGHGDISRARMRGSWAGAMGQTQFLPTSFLTYAVDADDDGRRDIWGSILDVMASTANYLAQNGWQTGSPWGREVVLPAAFDYAQTAGDTRHSTRRWRAMGVRGVDGGSLPAYDHAAIITPAGAHGPAFLVGPNFGVIRRYNNSVSYALAVGLLSDRLAGRPGVQQAWPRDLKALSRADVRAMQQALNALGYDVGAPDGLVGPNTRKGVRAFQRANGLTPDGYPTRALLRRIRAAGG